MLISLLLEPLLLVSVTATLVLSLLLMRPLAGRWKTPRWVVFGLINSAGIVFVALLVVGRGWVDLRRFDVTLISGCFDGVVEGSWNAVGYLNVVLFAPLAFFVVLVVRRALASGLGVCAIAFLLELLQNALDVGVCEEVDIARNLVGAIAGTVAGAIAIRWMTGASGEGKPQARSAR